MITMGKDPDAVLDYEWDWTTWLNGDVIAGTPDVEVVFGDVVVGSSTNTPDKVIAWISGGTDKSVSVVKCHIETVAGREQDRSIMFVIGEE